MMLVLVGGLLAPGFAQENDEDLYDLANVAADAEVEEADEVLAEDGREHGEQWLTRDRLVKIAGGWVLLQLVIMVLVIRDLRRRGRGWLAVIGWSIAIFVTSVLAGLIYWIRRKSVVKEK